jgi:hypothetical protein
VKGTLLMSHMKVERVRKGQGAVEAEMKRDAGNGDGKGKISLC